MRFAVPVLLAVLTACTPGVDAQLDELVDDVAALSEENAVLATQNDELSRTLDAVEAELISVEAQLDELLSTCGDEPATTTPKLPLVRVGSDRVSGVHAVAVEGEISRWEIAGNDTSSYPYDSAVWVAPDGACYTFTQSGYLELTVWVWQDDAASCYGAAEGCYPLVVTALDEMPC